MVGKKDLFLQQEDCWTDLLYNKIHAKQILLTICCTWQIHGWVWGVKNVHMIEHDG